MSDALKCAVVMSTYNGARYLGEQMTSLADQTRAPDYVLISDDGSTDGTVALARDFIRAHGMRNWELVENEQNRGWARNFHDIILDCDADVVFPCDQDDIWRSDKLAKMSAMMADNPGIDVLASSVETVYEAGAQVVNADDGRGGVSEEPYIQGCQPGFLYVRRPGSALCVRSSFAHEISGYWVAEWPHDATLLRFACVKGRLYYTDYVSMEFRRHAGNASSRSTVTRASRLENARYYIDVTTSLIDYAAEVDADRLVVSLLEDYRTWFCSRADFLSGERRASSLWQIAKWRGLYATSKGLPMDVACALLPSVDFHRLLNR